ncbi:MAG: DEAD/DEAH box helicase, partial [Acetobacteraceae bacterium]|nr:DEAD/DEAH box helicase [Acetobacteraceae bacterium]
AEFRDDRRPPRDDRGRDDRGRDERGRDDRGRDDRRDRRDRDDMGPSVRGFGDSIPAFMLIPIPRPRRQPAEPAQDQGETDAAA